MKNLSLILAILLTAVGASGQKPVPSLESVLANTREQIKVYRETFINLVADELKTIESVNASGKVKKSSRVKSELLIYKSDRANSESAELRVVSEVNGKTVPDARKRSDKLLLELSKTSTPLKELEKLERESTRFDRSLLIFGITLNQAAVLSPEVSSAFSFQLGEVELVDGHNTVAIKYLQIAEHPLITFDPKTGSNALMTYELALPDGIDASTLRLGGTLWIDLETFQIRRETRDVAGPPELSIPLLTMRYEYSASDFGILLPKLIFAGFNELKQKKGQFAIANRVTATFAYSNFRKTNVEVKISDSDDPANPANF
ncbi:MAG: hypothetical protein IPJ30_10900 [Acidobacteria bacterium]|nr:hypothetical protein [Acidobacteriota bacterium]